MPMWDERSLVAEAAVVFAEQAVWESPEMCRLRGDVAALLAALEAAGADHQQVGLLEDAAANLGNGAVALAAWVGVATARAFDPAAVYDRLLGALPLDVALAARRAGAGRGPDAER